MSTTAVNTRPGTMRPRSWALGLIAAAQFMVIMDTSIIGVALPEMRADLGFAAGELSWVFNAYVVAFGGLLLLGGRMSDLLGARRVFATGWAVLLAGSAMAGAAPNAAWELAGRATQGVGAALIAPAALTLLMVMFGGSPKELTKALAVYGAAAPAGGTVGVFLGGVITQYATWPWIFYLNIPIAAVALALIPSLLPAVPGRTGRQDGLGAATVVGGLAATVYAIVRAPETGVASVQTLGVGAAGVGLLGFFVLLQAVRRDPLVPLRIFVAPNLAAANVVQFLLGAAWIPMWFFLNLYLQQVLGFGSFASGSSLLPMTALIMVGMVAAAPRLIARYGPKAMVVTGMATLAAGMGTLSLIRANGSFWVDVLPASLIAAAGMSLAFIPSLAIALSSARPDEGGLAAGLVNTSYQVGSALGLAVMTAIATSSGADRLTSAGSLTHGFSAAFLGAGAVAVIGAAAAAVWLRMPRPRTQATEVARETVHAEPTF